jgi:hypothetical protein
LLLYTACTLFITNLKKFLKFF